MLLPAAMGRILFFSIDYSPRSYDLLKAVLMQQCITYHNSALSILLQVLGRVNKKIPLIGKILQFPKKQDCTPAHLPPNGF